MSRARFAAHFLATTGQTPFTYLAQWRLGIAQSLLKPRGPAIGLCVVELYHECHTVTLRKPQGVKYRCFSQYYPKPERRRMIEKIFRERWGELVQASATESLKLKQEHLANRAITGETAITAQNLPPRNFSGENGHWNPCNPFNL